ncbi:MAG: phage integrase, partial [Edaphobacter sp.]|nr:phage integrase [Edaphobacter sp.]
ILSRSERSLTHVNRVVMESESFSAICPPVNGGRTPTISPAQTDEGSSWSSLRQLGIYIAAAVSRMQLTSESRLTPKAIDIAAKAWANREPHASRLTDPQQVQRRFRVIVTDWFRFLGRLDEPPILEGPHHSVLQNFACFLRDERGLAEPTIKKQCDAAKEFLHSQLTLQTADGKPVLKGEKPVPFERSALIDLLTSDAHPQAKVFKSITIASRASGASGQPNNRATPPAVKEAKPQFGLR